MATSVTSVTSHFPEAENGFTTTTAGTVSSGATTVTLNSLSGYTNGEPVVFVIDPTDPTKKQTFTGIADTAGVQVTSVVWTAGTNQSHALGATVVDYATATHISMISKGIKVSHNQDGTMITSLPLTTPKITTSINDANGNEVIKTPATASAVNEVTITNAATGVAPSISATGGDTNIDLALTPKGTGKAYVDSLSQWQRGTGTWTYVSATTFTVPQADADAITKGTKLWFTQTTSKYFYVASISGTTVTLVVTTDYTLANAAITAPYYSNAATPFGFPDWFNYTPTLTNLSGGTINLAKYQITGKTVRVKFKYTLAGAGVSGAVRFALPVSANADEHVSGQSVIGSVGILDTGTAVLPGVTCLDATTGSALINGVVTNATYASFTGLTSTIPFTWAVNDQIFARGEYEIA